MKPNLFVIWKGLECSLALDAKPWTFQARITPFTLITNYTPNDILSLTLIYCFLHYSSKLWFVSSCTGEACLWDVGRKYQSFYFCLFINKTTQKLALVIFNKDATDPFPIGMSSVNKTGDLYTWKKNERRQSWMFLFLLWLCGKVLWCRIVDHMTSYYPY